MNINKFLIMATLVGCSSWLQAGSFYTGWVDIDQLSTGTGNDRVNIFISPIRNPAGCTLTDLYQVNEKSANKDKIFTIALSAYVARSKVELLISNSTCSESGRPLIQGIKIKH